MNIISLSFNDSVPGRQRKYPSRSLAGWEKLNDDSALGAVRPCRKNNLQLEVTKVAYETVQRSPAIAQ